MNATPCKPPHHHAAELAALDNKKGRTTAEAVAVADSLYSVHLNEGEQLTKVGTFYRVPMGQRSFTVAEKQGGGGGTVPLLRASLPAAPLPLAALPCLQKHSKAQTQPAACLPAPQASQLRLASNSRIPVPLPLPACRSRAKRRRSGSSGSGRTWRGRRALLLSWRSWETQVGGGGRVPACGRR